MATIKEIAEKVGVSPAAVSRVLNYDEGISVSDETRKAIFDTAKELGYKKKEIYPTIRNVAFLYWITEEEELEDVYYKDLYKEIKSYAKKVSVHLVVISKDEGIKAINKDITAFIALGWFSKKEIDALYKKCKNGVFVNSHPDEKHFDSVCPNTDSFVTQMVDYFYEKGHRRIGFVGMADRDINTGNAVMDIREWSFRQSMIYYKILDEDIIYITEHTTVNSGYKIGKKIALLKNRPTALVVGSDTLAIGLLQALNEDNIDVPDNIAVFSINDVSVAEYVSPPLTSFHIDIPVIAETAISLLRERVITKRKSTKTVYINGTVHFRKSC